MQLKLFDRLLKVEICYFLSETVFIKRFMASVTLNNALPATMFQPVKTATISYSGITIGYWPLKPGRG